MTSLAGPSMGPRQVRKRSRLFAVLFCETHELNRDVIHVAGQAEGNNSDCILKCAPGHQILVSLLSVILWEETSPSWSTYMSKVKQNPSLMTQTILQARPHRP